VNEGGSEFLAKREVFATLVIRKTGSISSGQEKTLPLVSLLKK